MLVNKVNFYWERTLLVAYTECECECIVLELHEAILKAFDFQLKAMTFNIAYFWQSVVELLHISWVFLKGKHRGDWAFEFWWSVNQVFQTLVIAHINLKDVW